MHGWRVLFVDDNFICNLESREFLRDQGINVEAVYCARAALQALNRREHLSALVTDIDLGAGLDGFDVARRAREVYPNLPVVFISGVVGARYASEGVEGSEFISKPFHPSQIVAALDRVIRLETA